MEAQGWYRDPYGIHEDRYFSQGQPTKLVRDGTTDSYDPPPPGPPRAAVVEASRVQPTDGSDLRRADDSAARRATFDNKAAFWAVLDAVAQGPVN
jgi:hypothetical protein